MRNKRTSIVLGIVIFIVGLTILIVGTLCDLKRESVSEGY